MPLPDRDSRSEIFDVGMFLLATLIGVFFLYAPGTYDMQESWGPWMSLVAEHGFVKGYAEIASALPPLYSVFLGAVNWCSGQLWIDPMLALKLSALLFLWITAGLFVASFRSWWAGAVIQLVLMLNVGLGYLDIYYAPFLVLCLLALRRGKVAWASFFYAIAAMIKPQPWILGPLVVIYALQQEILRDAGRLSWRRIATQLVLPAAIVTVPILWIYAGPLYAALRFAAEGNFVNGQAFNLGLLVNYAANVLAPDGLGRPGLDHLGYITLLEPAAVLTLPLKLLFFGAYFTVLRRYWRLRREGHVCFLKHAALAFLCYFCLGSGVHENHIFTFVLLLTMLALDQVGYRMELLAWSILAAMNLVLFYGIGGTGPPFDRSLGGILDLAVPFSVVTLGFFAAFFTRVFRAPPPSTDERTT